MRLNGWVSTLRSACRRDGSRGHGSDDGRGLAQGAGQEGLQQDRAIVVSWLEDVEELANKACDLPHPELKALAASLHAQAGSIREQLHLS